jgi:hypothetical protein
MSTKYARIVVRIAEREGITCRKAVRLYQEAWSLGIRNYSQGLPARIAKAKEQHK